MGNVVFRMLIGPAVSWLSRRAEGKEGCEALREVQSGTIELSDFWIYKSTFNF